MLTDAVPDDGLDAVERAEMAVLAEAKRSRENAIMETRRARIPGIVQRHARAYVSSERAVFKADNFRESMKNRVINERVEKHMMSERALSTLGADLGEAMSKASRSVDVLDDLESRLVRLRTDMRHANDDAEKREMVAVLTASGETFKASTLLYSMSNKMMIGRTKPATSVIADELAASVDTDGFESCPKCFKKFLAGMLGTHLSSCDGEAALLDETPVVGVSSSGGVKERNDDFNSDDDADDDDDDDDEGGNKKKNDEREYENRASSFVSAGIGNLRQCPICMHKYANKRFTAHMKRCSDKLKLRESMGNGHGQKAIRLPLEYCVLPGEPKNVRGMTPESDKVSVMWECPFFDGGAPIFDYQIEYFKRVYSCREVGREEFEDIRQPSLSTSRWLNSMPVLHNGATISDLRANSEIVKIRVRAVTIIGAGPWSEECLPIRTLKPTVSSPVLHLRLTEPPTSSSIRFTWELPFFTGGLDVRQYEIRYAQKVVDFATAVRLGVRTSGKLVESVVRIAAPSTTYSINGLFGESVITGITVFAVTDAGLSTASNRLNDIVTKPMTREQTIVVELADKRSRRDLDVEVWYQDTAQRVNRLKYIDYLEAELMSIQKRSSSSSSSGGGGSPMSQTKSPGGGGGGGTASHR